MVTVDATYRPTIFTQLLYKMVNYTYNLYCLILTFKFICLLSAYLYEKTVTLTANMMPSTDITEQPMTTPINIVQTNTSTFPTPNQGTYDTNHTHSFIT